MCPPAAFSENIPEEPGGSGGGGSFFRVFLPFSEQVAFLFGSQDGSEGVKKENTTSGK